MFVDLFGRLVGSSDLRDFVFDGDYLQEWRRRFPKAEVHTFSAAGHYVLEDVPDGIVKRVKDFLIKYPLP